MKFLITVSTLALLMTPAFAQTSTAAPQNSQSSDNSSGAGEQQTSAAAQKLKQTLESQGFTDVKVVARSFVVQGKSPDGDPILMTIGPHGMSVFEAMNSSGSGQTTGSTAGNSSSGTNSSGATSAPKPNAQTQK